MFPVLNIFKFPWEPLINWLPLPKKNLSVSKFTDEPLRKAFSAFRTKLVVGVPIPSDDTVVPKETKLLLSALNRKAPLLDMKAFQPLL